MINQVLYYNKLLLENNFWFFFTKILQKNYRKLKSTFMIYLNVWDRV